MKLSTIHPTTGLYTVERNDFIKQYENDKLAGGKLAFLDAHFEGKSMAFGYGYDLFQNLATLQADLSAFVAYKVTSGASSVTEALQNVYDLVDANTQVVNGKKEAKGVRSFFLPYA